MAMAKERIARTVGNCILMVVESEYTKVYSDCVKERMKGSVERVLLLKMLMMLMMME